MPSFLIAFDLPWRRGALPVARLGSPNSGSKLFLNSCTVTGGQVSLTPDAVYLVIAIEHKLSLTSSDTVSDGLTSHCKSS